MWSIIMSKYRKYLAISSKGIITELLSGCDEEEEETKQMVTEFLHDHPEVNEVALYKLQKIGIRQSEIKWEETFKLEAPNDNGEHHYQPWTADEDTYLVDARKAEIPYANIAIALGRTERAIEVQASRLRCG
jgi:hypothetical protein